MAKSETNEEMKMSLKILIDTEANKVVFAEAGKEFVDFLFQIMSLPLSTASKLLNDNNSNMAGSLGILYKSMESLDAQYYEQDSNKHSLKIPKAFFKIPLFSLNNAPTSSKFYKCGNHYSKYVTDRRGAVCPSCNYGTMSEQCDFEFLSSKTPLKFADAGYVKGPVPYIVMDNLEFKPMSVSLIMSIVKNYDSLKEKEVEFGPQEGLALLKASLDKQAVLTSVFLKKKI